MIKKYQNAAGPLPDTQFGGFRMGANGVPYFLTPQEIVEYNKVSDKEREELANSEIGKKANKETNERNKAKLAAEAKRDELKKAERISHFMHDPDSTPTADYATRRYMQTGDAEEFKQNAKISAIAGGAGTAMAAAAATAPYGTPYVTHVGRVMFNPLAAKTTAGAIGATALDAAGAAYGLHENSQLLNKGRNGQFNWSDPALFGLNLMGLTPYANAAARGLNYGADAISAVNDAKKAAKKVSNVNRNNNVQYKFKDFGNNQDEANALKKLSEYIGEENVGTINSFDDVKKIYDKIKSGEIKVNIPNFNHGAFVENGDKFSPYLSKKNIGRKYLRHIISDLPYMGEYNVKTPIDEDVLLFYKNDVWPRLKGKIEEGKMSIDDSTFKELEQIFSSPANYVNFWKGYMPGSIDGYTRGLNVVFPNNRSVDLHTGVHEIHHASRNKAEPFFITNPQLQQFSKDINETNKYNDLTNDVRSHLIEPYFPGEGESMLPLAAAKKTHYSQIEEMGASAAEGRFLFGKQYKDKYGKIPTVDELNKFIDESSESMPELLRYKLPTFNDYMNDFGGIHNSKNIHEAYEKELAEYRKLRDSGKRKPKLKWRVKNPKPEMSPFLSNYKPSKVKLEHQKQLYEYWKNAMKNISGYALPIAGSTALVAGQQNDDEQPSMKLGGLIKRIK